jgi:hypothetical protein
VVVAMGFEEGGRLAYDHPLISAGHRGGGKGGWPRVTEGEITSGGARNEESRPNGRRIRVSGGADRDRTDDLLNAIPVKGSRSPRLTWGDER